MPFPPLVGVKSIDYTDYTDNPTDGSPWMVQVLSTSNAVFPSGALRARRRGGSAVYRNYLNDPHTTVWGISDTAYSRLQAVDRRFACLDASHHLSKVRVLYFQCVSDKRSSL